MRLFALGCIVPSNFRMQATAGDLRRALIQVEASPAAPDPERSADQRVDE
jgi:hypothetical protein